MYLKKPLEAQSKAEIQDFVNKQMKQDDPNLFLKQDPHLKRHIDQKLNTIRNMVFFTQRNYIKQNRGKPEKKEELVSIPLDSPEHPM